MSHVACHLSLTPTAKATDSPRLIPPKRKKKNKIASSQAKLAKRTSTKIFWNLEVGVLQWHTLTDTHTDGHRDSMTKSA